MGWGPRAYVERYDIDDSDAMRKLLARIADYKLIDLANAAGMSISGIRTAYDTDEIDQATEILERPPASPPQPAGER